MNSKAKKWIRRAIVMLLDAILIALGVVLATLLRYGGGAQDWQLWRIIRFWPLVMVLDLTFMSLFHVYSVQWRFADVRDMLKIVVSIAMATLVSILINRILGAASSQLVSRLVIGLNGVISVLFIVTSRYIWSLLQDRLLVEKSKKHVRRSIIIGVNAEGIALVKKLSSQSYDVRRMAVGFLDEDVEKLYRRMYGILVEGTLADIGQVVRRKHVDEVIFANRDYSNALIRDVYLRSRKSGCDVLVCENGQIQKMGIEGFLVGWKHDECDESVRAFYKGKRVLVIGSGCVGSELVRNLSNFETDALVVADASEHALDRNYADNVTVRVADIRNGEIMEKIFREARPDFVFYTAAMTRPDIAGRDVVSLVCVNVLGAEAVWTLAQKSGARRFVMVSDVRAYAPETLVDASRALGEQAVLSQDGQGMQTLCVRLGNVSTTRSGILKRLFKQIRADEEIHVAKNESISFISAQDAAVQVLNVFANKESGIYMLDTKDDMDAAVLLQQMIDETHSKATVIVDDGEMADEVCAQKADETEEAPVFKAKRSVLSDEVLDRAAKRIRSAAAANSDEEAESVLKDVSVPKQTHA